MTTDPLILRVTDPKNADFLRFQYGRSIPAEIHWPYIPGVQNEGHANVVYFELVGFGTTEEDARKMAFTNLNGNKAGKEITFSPVEA